MIERYITLSNGVTIPLIGHGSWANPTEEEQSKVKGWVASALKVCIVFCKLSYHGRINTRFPKAGYRHIDTALMYRE